MSALPLVAFDEAGNSGGNLLDKEQPVFALASVHLSEDEAHSLAATVDKELKFASLKRSADGRKRILKILDSEVLQPERFFISIYHKRFTAMTKLIDMLVEPIHHQRGVDLYERGANLGLANLWYYTLPTFLGRHVFDMLIERFVLMIREPSVKTLQRFYGLVETAHRKHKKESYALDLSVILATRQVAERGLLDFDGSDLDPAVPAFAEHASKWTKRLSTAFRIVHDQSKPIANEQLLLEAMMNASEVPKEIGYDRRKMTFPFAASGIEFADSRDIVALQIADVIASSAAYYLRAAVTGTSSDLCDALGSTRVFNTEHSRVWPVPKFTPAELGTEKVGGIEPNDHIGAYVAQRLGGIPPKGQRRKS